MSTSLIAYLFSVNRSTILCLVEVGRRCGRIMAAPFFSSSFGLARRRTETPSAYKAMHREKVLGYVSNGFCFTQRFSKYL